MERNENLVNELPSQPTQNRFEIVELDLAKQDLARARQAFREELARLDRQIAQHQAELSAAKQALDRSQELRGKNLI